MSPDLEAVLALQAEDTIVAQLNEKLRALDSQLIALDAERKQVEDSLARAKTTAEQEEKKRRELSIKVEDEQGGGYVVRVAGTDQFKNAIVADQALEISGKADETRLRLLTDRQSFKVGESASVNLHSRSKPGRASTGG